MSYTKRLSLICAICLGTFMATLDISIVNVALPTIQNDINANMATLQWIVDAYALCLSACILSSGPLSDRFGRKKCGSGGDYFHSRLPYLCYCTTT